MSTLKPNPLRDCGRFQLTTFEVFMDGSMDLAIYDPGKGKPLHALSAFPSDQGFDVKLFNRQTGVMDEYFSLVIAKEFDAEGLPTPKMLAKVFENCCFYLDGNHVDNMANIKVDLGDQVICDYCNEDFTSRDDVGGFLFGGYATCPLCAPRVYKDAKEFDELNKITKRCPEGMSFREFVLTKLR